LILIFWFLWLLFGIIALGPAAFIFFFMSRKAKQPWQIKINPNYKPKISVIVPTYNEASIIELKLANLKRLSYQENLIEILIVDSNSTDGTIEKVRKFVNENPEKPLRILMENERKGKSHALNYALSQCTGDVIVVSDADCFWPSDILEKAVPFLADQSVGAVSGPKILLNSNQTWITRMETAYLKSANALRLGESKAGSTLFFEGGFSAFKREAFEGFDLYRTGSDDCGTVVRVIEKGFRALLVPEAFFYSSFPVSFKEKLGIKLRRANQLVRLFWRYFCLLLKGKVKTTRITVVPNVFLYLFSPITFIILAFLSGFLAFSYPYLLLCLLILVVPKVRFYFYTILESNTLLFLAIFGVAIGRRFSVWNQPKDRISLSKKALSQLNLV